MVKKANINWTAKQLVKMTEKGTINFNNSVQRGYVWDDKRKSLLIHSMIVGYPIPAFYAAKNENGYDMLDGKQRSNAVKDFLTDSFLLVNVPEIELEQADGSTELVDINGMKFSELPEDVQDTITSYSLTVYYFDGITDDEITEMFFRLNNGKPLTAIELTRVKAKSIEIIKEIGKHNIFNDALTEKALNKYTNEDITIKAWAILNAENPSFETKSIRPMMETADITEQQAQDIKTAFTRILDTYNDIKAITGDADTEKKLVKIAKRVFTRTHLVTLVPLALRSVNEKVTVKGFSAWVQKFYSGKKSASISEQYNDNAASGSAKPEAIRNRLEAITADYEQWFKNIEETA